MFPINLQKNIDQLGKQITLLENECKNMEKEKKKRSLTLPPTLGSKASSVRTKPSVVKIAVKKTNSSKKVRKLTPPISARVPSTNSQQSQCSKTCSENDGIVRRKGLSVPVGSSELIGSSQATSRKENRCRKCVCCNQASASELDRGDSTERDRRGHVLHKELLFPDSGGTIEVTVTQKPNNKKENSVSAKTALPKVVNLNDEVEKEIQDCKCQIRGQKWADILSSDNTRKEVNSVNARNKDEVKAVYQLLNLNKCKGPEAYEIFNNAKPIQQKETLEVPVKLPIQSHKTAVQQSEINTDKFEKDTQYSLEKSPGGDFKVNFNSNDELNAFHFLINKVLQRQTDESGKLTISLETLKKIREALKEPEENRNHLNLKSPTQNSTSYKNILQSNWDNLKKEKELLSQEILAKDNLITTLKKREDDYLTLINNLKSSLEKNKGNAQEIAEAVKEINFFKAKLLQQMKVSEALKENHSKMQKVIERCTLENDRLRTQLKICKLEAQKHEVLLAGKEAQISRYKEEIQNFQRQISEHLASLKSNAQGIDVEKMMEAIVQQTQLFVQVEEDSVFGNDPKDGSEGQNALIHSTPHSSPTSNKNSILNSSWKRISSIHDQEPSRANSDVGIYLNDDSNQKDFFQVFGDNSNRESKSSKKSGELDKEVKRSSSFTSCLTQEDQNSTKSSNRDSAMSKESTNSGAERPAERLEKEKRVSSDVAQSNIEKLLKNMKLKFSKEVFDTSFPSCGTEDLDFSQISSMSPVK